MQCLASFCKSYCKTITKRLWDAKKIIIFFLQIIFMQHEEDGGDWIRTRRILKRFFFNLIGDSDKKEKFSFSCSIFYILCIVCSKDNGFVCFII